MECNHRSCSSSDTTDYNKNKLLFKFKIPKNCSGVDEQAGGLNMMISNNNFKRVCPECNKEFDSGQALGGHMRIHAQHENYSGTDSDNSMSDYYVSCSLCDKEFPSIKSLFGHMRCHPERDWRPPCGYISSSSISKDDEEVKDYGDDGDMVVDCTEMMPKWPVKGPVKARRGHKGIKRGFSVGCDVDDEEEMKLRDCVSGLLLLSQVMDGSDSSGLSTLGAAAVQQINGGDQHHEEVTNDQSWIVINNREEEFDDTRFVANGFDELVGRERMGRIGKVVMRKMGTDQEDGSSDHVMNKDFIGSVGQEGNAAADHVAENHRVEDDSDGMNTELVVGGFDGINDKDNHGEKMVMENSKNNKDKKMKMKMVLLNQEKAVAVGSLVEAAGAWTATDKYKCSTCDKTFSSHQALGGHRSSHNKLKVTIINGESSTKKSVSAFAPPDHKFDQSQQQQVNTSHDQFNRAPMSEECATKRNSIYELGGSSKSDHISSTIHQCSVCNKIFASGQALGGHKRSHWTAPAAEVAQTIAQAPQAQLAVRSSGEEARTQAAGGKRIRLMGFDLNVPASMVDDAAAQDGGSGW